MIRETSFVDEICAPAHFVLAARHATVDALIDGVMQGQPFIALTGPAGIGKTTVASAIRDELVGRSVHVLEVRLREGEGISLRTIASQILGKSEAEMNDDDIEKLFDVMTMREVQDERFALIIDDAECLQADAIGYLRLLTLLARDTMPRIVFVGGAEFWDTDCAVRSDLKELITARWELPRLSLDEAREFIEHSAASWCPATEAVFAPGGIEALTLHGDGLCGRIASLMSLARTLRVEKHEHWLTRGLVDKAAAKLDAGEAAPLEAAYQFKAAALPPRSEVLLEPDVGATSADRRIVARLSSWLPRATRVAGVAAVLFAIVVVASRQTLIHIPRTDARPTAVDGVRPGAAAVPDHAATNDAATIAVSQVTSVPDVGADRQGPAAATADPRPVPSQVVTEETALRPLPAVAAAPAAAAAPAPVATEEAAPLSVPDATAPATAAAPASMATEEAAPPAAPAAVTPAPAATPAPVATEQAARPAAPAATVPAAAAPASVAAEEAAPQDSKRPSQVNVWEPATVLTQSAEERLATAPADVTSPREAAKPESQGDPATGAPAPAVTTTDAPAAPATISPASPALAVQPESREVATPAAAGATRKAVSSASTPPPSTPPNLTLLLSRGDAMLVLGDISAARLLYQRASALGSARAATAIGKTYDPAFLTSIRASGVTADRTAAAAWYCKGAALGDQEGADRLARLSRAQ